MHSLQTVRVRELGAPYATAVKADTTQTVAKRGVSLTGVFTYNDDDAGVEATDTYKWYESLYENGTYTEVTGETAVTFTPVKLQIGKYLKFGVTPVSDTVPLTGLEELSAPLLVYPQFIVEGSNQSTYDDWNVISYMITGYGDGTDADHLQTTIPEISIANDINTFEQAVKIANDDLNLYIKILTYSNTGSIAAPKFGMYIDKDGSASGVVPAADGDNIWNRAIRIESNHAIDSGWMAHMDDSTAGGVDAKIASGSSFATATTNGRAVAVNSGTIEIFVPLVDLNIAKGDTFDFRVFATGAADGEPSYDTGSMFNAEAAGPGSTSTLFTNNLSGTIQYTVK